MSNPTLIHRSSAFVPISAATAPPPSQESSVLIGDVTPYGGSGPSNSPLALGWNLWAIVASLCIIGLYIWIGLLGPSLTSSFDAQSRESSSRFQNNGIRFNESSVNNTYERSIVEVNVVDGPDFVTFCGGSFITATGHVLSAAHCYVDGFFPCDWAIEGDFYDMTQFDGYTFHVEVTGLNGTKERRTLYADLVGWSSILDIMVIKTKPTFYHNAEANVIDLVSTPFLTFANNSLIRKGDVVATMTHEDGFSKKLAKRASIANINKDVGRGFTSTAELHLIGTLLQFGSSGAAFVDQNGQIAAAPISESFDTSVTAVSARVTKRIVDRILDPLIPPDLFEQNRYLVPTLGFVPEGVGPIEFRSLYDYNPTAAAYVLYSENVGIPIDVLLDQDYYDFVTIGQYGCSFMHTPSAPSLLGATLDATIGAGTPPATFPNDPKFGDSNVMVIIKAIERTLDANDWVDLGSDTGTEAISGVIIGDAGKWAGDIVRVRIASFDPFDDTNLVTNWEGIYRVTLRSIDVYWDNQWFNGNFLSGSTVHVGENNTLYLNPDAPKPIPLAKRGRNARKPARASRFAEPPAGLDVTTLPTLSQKYREFRQERYPEERKAALKGKQNRDAFRARQMKEKKRGSQSMAQRTKDIVVNKRLNTLNKK